MLRIAIAGRPNVGKSALFNRVVGRRIAIVEATPGVTRDWIAEPANLGDFEFELIDTAGLDSGAHPRESLQAEIAIHNLEVCRHVDLLWFVIDARAGVLAEDEALLRVLRRLDVPILLLANKCEARSIAAGASVAAAPLGLGEPVELSAEHSLGFSELADASRACLARARAKPVKARREDGEPGEEVEGEEEEEVDDGTMKIAVAGRPNVGKSTLINALLGENRQLVSAIAGTTRDSVAVSLATDGGDLRLVDTAGLRRRARVDGRLEYLSGLRSREAIAHAEQVWLVLDAELGPDRQDLLLAARVLEEGRALLLVLNKIDAVASVDAARLELQERLGRSLSQAHGVPVVCVSALESRGLKGMLVESRKLHALWCTRVSTGPLNRWLQAAIKIHPPPARARFKYITQHKARPPSFSISCARIDSLPASYVRYLENSLREKFDLSGVPLRFNLRDGKSVREL